LILLSLTFSSQSFAQEWGTVFPTDKEMAKMDVTYADQKIIVQNHYYPKPEKFDEVLELRIEASKLLKKFGFKAGQILVTRQTMDRASGKQGEVAAIVWQAEYKNLSALKTEINSFSAEQNKQFQKEVLSKMKLLINRFKRTSSYVVFE
jgi:hypothetical protein